MEVMSVAVQIVCLDLQ